MEKVIKGLDVCLKNIDQSDCPNNCPYLSDCSKYENRVVFQPLMRDAVALLKEQQPKHGHWIDIDSQLYTWKVRCDQCGHERSMMSTQGKYPRFCEGCGAEMMIGR